MERCLIMWSNHGITCIRSSGDGTLLYQYSHPVLPSATSASRNHRPRLRIAHLHRSRITEEGTQPVRLPGLGGDENADPVIGEAGIEAHLPDRPREGEQCHAEEREQPGDQ